MTASHLYAQTHMSNISAGSNTTRRSLMPAGRNLALLTISLALFAASAAAKEAKFYQSGTIAHMESVACGRDENSGQGLKAVLIGSDSNHTKVRETLCQEYTLHSERVVYHIRPRDEKHPILLPVGESASFR